MGTSPATPNAIRQTLSRVRVTPDSRYHLLFAVGSAFAFAHTLDEMRIGQFIAVPFALANAFAVGAWPQVRKGWRAALAIAFGLIWIGAVLPYHVLPLLQGYVTWQNVSGLTRIVGGVILVATGLGLAVGGIRNARG